MVSGIIRGSYLDYRIQGFAMTIKKGIINGITGSLGLVAVFIIMLLHQAWGDERYVLKQELQVIMESARVEKIQELDAQLAIDDTEILFAETANEKDKLKAIKAIHERQKEALKAKDVGT